MSIMGTKMDEFQAPVCDSFRPKIFKGQLCYEVDPQEYRQLVTDKSKLSLSLLISLNEDRQFTMNLKKSRKNKKKQKQAQQKPLTLEIESESQHYLYIGTISTLWVNHIQNM